MHTCAAILYRLKIGESFTTIPTTGCNVETVRVRCVDVELWDVGGQENLRAQWSTYAAAADGVVYVVDAAALIENERRELELEAFETLVNTFQLRGLPLLLLANKQASHALFSVECFSFALLSLSVFLSSSRLTHSIHITHYE